MLTFINFIRATVLILAVLISTSSEAAEPEPGEFQTIEEGSVFFIPEVGAMVIQDGDEFVLEGVMPPETRPKQYRKIDIEDGDRVMMVNGKKVKSVQQVEELYSGLKIGADFKLGLIRDGNMMIASFPKADEKDLPKRKVMMISTDNLPDMENMPPDSGGGMKIIRMGGPEEGTVIFREAGMILTEKEDGLYFKELLPFAPEDIKKLGLTEKDRLISINDSEIEGSAEAVDLYDKARAGDQIDLLFSTESGRKNCSFEKTADQGGTVKKIINRK